MSITLILSFKVFGYFPNFTNGIKGEVPSCPTNQNKKKILFILEANILQLVMNDIFGINLLHLPMLMSYLWEKPLKLSKIITVVAIILSRRLSTLLKCDIDLETSITKEMRFGYFCGFPNSGCSFPRFLKTFFSPVAPSTNLVSSNSPQIWFFNQTLSFSFASTLSRMTRSWDISLLTTS